MDSVSEHGGAQVDLRKLDSQRKDTNILACHSSNNLPLLLNSTRSLCAFPRTVTHRSGGVSSKGVTMNHEKYLEFLFWSKVEVGYKTECWNWLGGKDKRGYGRLSRGGMFLGKTIKAHRTAWEFANGEIKNGLHVLHRCNNPSCCNPLHLYLGTHQQNMSDALADRLFTRGENRKDAILTEEEVREIRKKFIPRKYSMRVLAQEFGVSNSAIANVVYGKAWKWVE